MGSRRGAAAWGRREPAPQPLVDVLVATAGRTAELATVLAGLAGQDDPPFRVVLSDQSDDHALAREPAVQAIADQLRRAAHDIRLDLRRTPRAGDVEPTATTTIPALTAPLQLTAPSATNWIVVGSLMEDLRRIHEQLSDERSP